MNKYIFLSKENEGLNNLEFSSFLDIIDGENKNDAFEKLKIKYDYIGNSGDYENYSCYELKNGIEKEFSIIPD